ncbi:MAG TPA: transcriptional regulator [Streptosporangiaceae bacterium]|nr:transcriptional regulator [Streptosporangiaceae bacterium]
MVTHAQSPRLPRPRPAPDARKAREDLLGQGTAPAGVRAMVADSWLRSAAAGVNADNGTPPIALAADLLADYRAAHPLAGIFPLLYDVVGRAAEDCDSVLAVADERGRLLWVRGHPAVLRRAESIQFVEGAQWDERHAGTNAPGTALCLDAPVTIRSAEHFVRPVQRWSCAAAPVHELGSGAILGVVDVTGGPAVDSPQTLAMVRAAARMAESELARRSVVAATRYPDPEQAVPPGRHHPIPEVRLAGLGRPECAVSIGPRTLRLSPRHSEIMIILAECPAGLTGDELAYLLYPDDLISSTLRAELVRLRALVGGQVLASRPYRLICEVTSDWAAVSARLAAGDLAEALRLYRGPLLPRSEAPGVAELRENLDRALRAAVLASGQPEFLVGWARSRWGTDDLEVWQRLCAVLPASSPLRPFAAATAAKLDAELAC